MAGSPRVESKKRPRLLYIRLVGLDDPDHLVRHARASDMPVLLAVIDDVNAATKTIGIPERL